MSLSPVHEPPHRQNQKEGDIGGNDGSGKVGVSHDLPQYQPCEDAHVEQIRKEIEVNLTHTHRSPSSPPGRVVGAASVGGQMSGRSSERGMPRTAS